VAHEDRRRVERADDRLEVLDDGVLDRLRVLAQRLDLDLEARVARRQDAGRSSPGLRHVTVIATVAARARIGP
jgi:hypothetical protein